MKQFILLFVSLVLMSGLSAQDLNSPDNNFQLTVSLNDQGIPFYSLRYKEQDILKAGRLGLKLSKEPSLDKGFEMVSNNKNSKKENWTPVWGEEKSIQNQYNELEWKLRRSGDQPIEMIIRFRLFNDGLGFRYEFPRQHSLAYFDVMDELTQFALAGDHKVWWIPGDYDTNEYSYTNTRISTINASEKTNAQEIFARSPIGNDVVQTPLMMKSDNGIYINIHEAGLVDYSAMQLRAEKDRLILNAMLVPDPLNVKAHLQTPCNTPWRTIIVSDDARRILMSRMILNLNEPCKFKSTSWIKPQKFIGIWWDMHVGKSTWNYSDTTNLKLKDAKWSSLKANGKHGATTARTKKLIDFASRNGFDGVLVEGWNIGWEDWFGMMKEDVFDFVTPYPDFNVKELSKYARDHNVRIIMHHETSASATNYERRMDTAFRFMKENGYNSVKTGYVGRIIPRGEHHDGQWMVNHYVRVVDKAKDYEIMVDSHEPVRPTGVHRTYPNWLACEAARGNEFNAWSEGSPPEHETILPFTRIMGGPMDYTPGIFKIKLDTYRPGSTNKMHTTLCKQLALYVTMYSPLQMAADLIENYESKMDAFQFIKDVAVDWDNTWVLEAEPGDFITTARKAKGKNEFFIGAITDENPREAVATLDFIPSGKKYEATIYADAPDAHWDHNPEKYVITKQLVSKGDVLRVKLAPGGGAAISIKEPAPAVRKK
ncbi:MAG: glycoside hydrolase family 97 protein [Saprospiraceae bacterium]|nr:glycoside hydrolase family 97 protein [Saprospiraceae bacterium]HMX88491.1 glycoside hydrolase family 97 protein [Saprospiraceae bacterium]HMZ40509.1 glycoside hydrolase family 97 protein [Saprospiraceae bacterium]HNA64562.1 glycoside hydrolase family 97 protein [Saprospiraceae bacterium]HNB30713.1 glycoside hydrolase family 97 protein [Saprospiraceae bacterium]